jgi:hypothetical protein
MLSLSPKLYDEIKKIKFDDISEILIHLNCKTQNKFVIEFDENIDLLNLSKSYFHKENIIYCQFKDLCMEINESNKKFYSKQRIFIGCENNILIEMVTKENIDSECFPILKKYPIEKNINIIQHKILNNSSSIFIIEKYNNYYNMYIKIKEKSELIPDNIKRLLNTLNKKITKNKK